MRSRVRRRNFSRFVGIAAFFAVTIAACSSGSSGQGLVLRGRTEPGTQAAAPAGKASAELLLIARGRSSSLGALCAETTQHRASVSFDVLENGSFEIRVTWKEFEPVSHERCPLASLDRVEVQALRATALMQVDGSLRRAEARMVEDQLKRSSDGAEGRLALSFDTAVPPGAAVGVVDLEVDARGAAGSWQIVEREFTQESCAMKEGCVGGSGLRRLLTFDGILMNSGTIALEIGAPSEWAGAEYDACHAHFHLADSMSYELLDTNGAVVIEGQKRGFCLMDSARVGVGGAGVFTCSNQGISAGWADVYDRSLDCQWIDVTGVSPGAYRLRLTANPDFEFEESNYENNSVEIPVAISEPSRSVRVGGLHGDARSGRLQRQ